ncbi:MAG TPA: radical SAM protein [Candidatus Methylomirabilis sp.]|nr:radical SAM protein [Candidatus Methylomirabilis sp.]
MNPARPEPATPASTASRAATPSISWIDWLRWGPFLAQLIVTRRCNLACAYCTEYDKTSEPVPFDALQQRLERLRDLRTWAVSLMGGEPTLHPDLLRIVSTMRELGFRRRMMTTNGLVLTRPLVDGLSDSGLTHMSLSIDGVTRNPITVKVLDTLKDRLDVLAERARFEVVVSAVVGSAPAEEVVQVAEFAKSRGFTHRLLLLNDPEDKTGLSASAAAVYAEVTRSLGRPTAGRGYREHLTGEGEAPFRCRSGARYLYVDEFGVVRWCSETRTSFGKDLSDYTVDDLRWHFHSEKACSAQCRVACVRSVSALDRWRSQRL